MKKTKEYGRIGVCLCGALLIIGTVCMGGCEAKAERITEDVFVIGGEDEEMYESNGHADEQLPPAFQPQGEEAAAPDNDQPPVTQEKAEQTDQTNQVKQNSTIQTISEIPYSRMLFIFRCGKMKLHTITISKRRRKKIRK